MKDSITPPLQRNVKRIATAEFVLFVTLLLVAPFSKVSAEIQEGNDLSGRPSLSQPEKVSMPSEDGAINGGTPTMLTGYLFRPDGPGPFPALVALHGCGGLFTAGKLNARFADWGPRLSALGYVVLFPDSFTPRGISESCTQKNRSGFSAHKERPKDAYGALHWLQNQSMVAKERIGLIGWSNGGSTLLATIGESKEKDKSVDFQVAIAFYPGCSGFAKKSLWQPHVPLTILIGEADDWTPAESCKTLIARAKEQGHPADIFSFPNAFHDFDHPNLSVKTRQGLAFTVNGLGTARVGTDTSARAASLELVPQILARFLAPSPGT
jgi:dienelactone hydrolase